MPFERPTLEKLIDRSNADISARLQGVPGSLRHNILDVLGKVHAGAMHSMYGALDFYAQQLFASTAEAEFLEEKLGIRGIYRLPAQEAIGRVSFSGAAGSLVPADLQLEAANGQRYTVLNDVSIDESGQGVGEVQALIAGTVGNLPQNQKLNLVSTVLNVDDTAIVLSPGLDGGAETETDDAYRLRGLFLLQGSNNIYGKPGDWVAWALSSTTEIKKAFETPNFDNVGRLLIQVVGDNKIVSPAGVQMARDYILSRAPVGVAWDVQSCIIVDNDIELEIVPGNNQNHSYVQELIENALSIWYDDNAAPGLSITPTTLESIILGSVNLESLTIKQPSEVFTHAINEFPTLGTVRYV